MKRIKENLLIIVNILVPIMLFVILLFAKLSENTVYLMIMSLIIGWVFPYFVLIITGIALINKSHYKLSLIFNIFNILLCLLLIGMIIYIIDKEFIVMLIEYIIITIISIINVIYLKIYLKKHPNPEIIAIKKAKKENNGAVL